MRIVSSACTQMQRWYTVHTLLRGAQHKQSIAFGPNKMCLWFHPHGRNFISQSNQSRDLNPRNKFQYRRKT